MFAIVDIETTGGNAGTGAITEIAIFLHNGQEMEGCFESLVNPGQEIPRYITALTGITNQMVENSPNFSKLAPKIYALLKGRIFVAHNVNFDFSFVHHHLKLAGIDWQAKKLCTVRYARLVFPGQPSYSLGNITRQMGIDIAQRHRAAGDAQATMLLLEKLMAQDLEKETLNELLKGRNPNSYLPMNLPVAELTDLPYCPGVYYFLNQAEKVIYVGKARNLKYRVRSHFTNNNTNQRKQEFIRNIFSIKYKVCATELMAFVLELLEIKRLWPPFNRSQKGFEQKFGLYIFEDQLGLLRITMEKKRKAYPPIYAFNRLEEGYSLVRKLMQQFKLAENMTFATANVGLHSAAERELHNLRINEAINYLQNHLPHFGLVQTGTDQCGKPQHVGYLVKKGQFVGMGYLPAANGFSEEAFENCMTPYPDFEFVRKLICQEAENQPEAVLRWDNDHKTML